MVLSGVQLGQEQLQTFRLVGDAPAEQAKDLIAPAAQVDVVEGIVVVLQDCVFQTVQAGESHRLEGLVDREDSGVDELLLIFPELLRLAGLLRPQGGKQPLDVYKRQR